MKVVTFNANGIRSAASKGFFEWLSSVDADVVCVQETRAKPDQLKAEQFFPDGYHCWYNSAERPGYAGTAIFSKVEPNDVVIGLGWDPVDDEGRWIQLDFKDVSIVSFYLPSGSAGDEKQVRKEALMARMLPEFDRLSRQQRETIICADWNICHKEIDLKNWRSNRKNSGFLPEERAWLDTVFDELGWVDAFRRVNPHPEQYTWWSNRGQARAKNVGWRLDYMVTTPGLADKAVAADIYTGEKLSDHAPLTMEFDWEL